MSQEPLERVKHYLTEKEFGKARAVLIMIDHPKRDEWLQRVDALERQQEVEAIAKPWNPGWMGWLTLLTPIVSTLMLAWNWRRFGKKSWTWWTILGFVLLIPLLIVTIMGLVSLTFALDPSIKFSGAMLYLTIFTSIILVIFYPFLISGRQGQAYKLIKQKNIYAAYAHRYDWRRGILIWVLSSLMFGGVFTWMMVRDADSFDSETIHLDVPYEWQVNDEDYDCSYFDEGCSFVLSGRFAGLNISFHEGGWIDDYETNQAAADSMWDWANESDEFIPISRETISIAGRKAFIIRYQYNKWYWTDIFLQEGDDHLRVLVEGYNARVIDNNWRDILSLLHSIEWRP